MVAEILVAVAANGVGQRECALEGAERAGEDVLTCEAAPRFGSAAVDAGRHGGKLAATLDEYHTLTARIAAVGEAPAIPMGGRKAERTPAA